VNHAALIRLASHPNRLIVDIADRAYARPGVAGSAQLKRDEHADEAAAMAVSAARAWSARTVGSSTSKGACNHTPAASFCRSKPTRWTTIKYYNIRRSSHCYHDPFRFCRRPSVFPFDRSILEFYCVSGRPQWSRLIAAISIEGVTQPTAPTVSNPK
jgi:hypothetical protein